MIEGKSRKMDRLNEFRERILLAVHPQLSPGGRKRVVIFGDGPEVPMARISIGHHSYPPQNKCLYGK